MSQSPKVEEYTPKEGDRFTPYLFMVIHAVDYSRKDGVFATSELNFFLGKNFLVTYHELPLKERAYRPKSVAYAALCTLRGRPIGSRIRSWMGSWTTISRPWMNSPMRSRNWNTRLCKLPIKQTLNRLLQIKKEVLHLRHIVSPQREVLARFAHGEFKLIRPHLVPYYRDVYDGLFHISELAQRYTDSLTGILQVYLNMSANQTGDIIKLLTLITVITTPIMIVGTWYGMNFEGIHELKWNYGYEIAIAVTLVATGLTVWWFKKNKWL